MNEENTTKDEIEEGIFYSNYKEMKEEMKRYEKLEDMKYEDFRKEQDYMHGKSVEKARLAIGIQNKN